jgi:hypothetical protein
MTIAAQVRPPVIHPGFGFDRQTWAAGDRRCAQAARESVRRQLGRDLPGHHVCEFPSGIVLHCVARGAIEAGQEVGCVRDEGQGELDVDTSGKPLARQKDRAGDLIRSIGTETLAGRVPDGRRQQQNNAQNFREGTFADTAQVRSVGSGSHARTGKASA